MKAQSQRLLRLCILIASLITAASLSAQTLNFLTTAPTPTNNDVFSLTGSLTDAGNVNDGASNYVDGAANDAFTYVSFDRPSQGQTFTTGPNAGRVTAIWVRQVGYTNDAALTWWNFITGNSFTFRITDPSQAGNAGFVLDTETYAMSGLEPNKPANGVQSTVTGTGLWLRFGLTNDVELSPNTTYGFDITSLATGGSFFESWGTSNDVYGGGSAYTGTGNGTPTNTMTALVGDRAFLVEFNGGTFTNPPVIAPVITNQPANAMVPQGGNATFTPGISGTPPYTYQWYFNTNTMLSGQTNATLDVFSAETNVGAYSVIVSNDGGSDTSSVARLSVILPSFTTNLNFSTGSGSILDANGVSTPFTTRLPGTGASLPSPDTSLLLNTNDGTLAIASTTCDYNGQQAMDVAEAPGILLSSIGFNGTQDFSVTGTFTNLPTDYYVNYDQVGVYAGASSTNMVRGGLIFNSDFANLSSYAVATPGNNDAGIATAAAPPPEMVVTIARANGVWSANVNGLSVTPNASLAFLNSYTDLTVGVFALDTSGINNIDTVNGFGARLFDAPKLNVKVSGSSLTFDWNVLSQGLESSTDLSNPNGWTLVPGTGNTNQMVIPLPTTGAKFYRIAP